MKQGLAVVAVMSVLMAGAEEWCADDRVPFADPFILCHGGKYYAYGTSGEDGIGVAVSDDLRTWRWWQGAGKDGYALHKEDSWGKKWFWAPEVYARDGRFVMYYSAEVHVCAAVAESPLGPFRQIKKEPILPGYSAIDNTLVEDGGKVRMFFTGGPDGKPWGVYSIEMSADGLTADPKTVRPAIRAEQTWEKHTGAVNEGSFVVRVGDRYVMSYSGNDYQDHLYGLGIATAKDIDGPWTKFVGNPVFQRGFGLYGTGHHALFKDNAGRWRIVFHAHNSKERVHPRCMYIADVDFPVGSDGEPTMKVGGELITCRKAAANAKPPEWEDLKVNSINRLPPRTYAMPLADESAALTDALEPETPYKQSLNGKWKFSWAGNPDLRVREFWQEDFADTDWFDIDVPSCVELKGFGSPGYTNIRYPFANEWPKILDRQSGKPDYNPVSSYRRTFTVPDGWKGRQVILRFDGVYSAYYVWVNGRRVGYAEDSKLPSEFDVTPYLNPKAGGANVLAVEVYRWCDGSYLEDQDMTHYSGIFRDVTLWARPKDGIWDFSVRTTPVGGYKTWRLEVEVPDATNGAPVSASLYDAAFQKVGDLFSSSTSLKLDLSPRPWSAEKPYLYTLVVRKGDDIRMRRVGFKEQKIVGNAFLVNGQKVKFKGVNRHETSPDNGRAITLDDMLADIRLMKRYNINTVRTSHYPDHHLWYDLCDRYGIYLCAEANVEGHEPGYEKDGLGLFAEWNDTIVERNQRHVAFYRNHPAVTLWSLGNETGHGLCFSNAAAVVHATDPSRPVHWERGNDVADIDSRMYPTVEWLEERGNFGDGVKTDMSVLVDNWYVGNPQHAGRVFFLCEYAHAMGNAIGNFREYWDVFYRHDSLSGGCIWDWVDQAVWKYTDKIDPKTGTRERFLSYGGDFDEEPNDGPFNCNGVVDPFRNVSAKLIEVGHVHRNLVVTRSVAPGDNGFAIVFELWNRHAFTRADEFVGVWCLRENGVVTKRGAFEPPALAPLSRCRFTVPGLAEALASAAAGAELLVDFEFQTRHDELWAKKGWVVARDQVALGGAWNFAAAQGGASVVAPKIEEGERTVTVTCGKTKAVFCRQSGTLCELVMAGRRIVKDPAPGIVAGPRLTCARAFVDNDCWLRDNFYRSGLTQLRYHARPMVVDGATVKTVVEVTGSKSAGFTHETTWRFAADGSVVMENAVTPHGTMPKALPRLGLSMRIAEDLNVAEWYGRGPRENYVDRCSGSFLGVWHEAVENLGETYVRPQDNGFRSDVRWLSLVGGDDTGVRFAASEPLFVQALKCGWEDLEFARHSNGQQRFRTAIAQDGWIDLNLDIRQLGLGGASCGPTPMSKYVFPMEPLSWTLTFSPATRVR